MCTLSEVEELHGILSMNETLFTCTLVKLSSARTVQYVTKNLGTMAWVVRCQLWLGFFYPVVAALPDATTDRSNELYMACISSGTSSPKSTAGKTRSTVFIRSSNVACRTA